ncbi:nitrous oxide-stimulated promoter family protein [Photobacterium ganghwense]|uniref:nitrous oxide-stimulated promoter family protein n=1 Tax=Photobacterium ganghwense TaxID=320778 RepID=UPI0039EE5D0C
MNIQSNEPVRQQRELDITKAMIRLYCKTLHRGAIVCPECEVLIDYVEKRIASCRLGEAKPNCLVCETPCYQPAKRLHFVHVLRWSMRKFAWRQPIKALKFKIDCLRRCETESSSSVSS